MLHTIAQVKLYCVDEKSRLTYLLNHSKDLSSEDRALLRGSIASFNDLIECIHLGP